MPGETGYRVIGDDGQMLSDGSRPARRPRRASLVGGQAEWWQTTWSSVVGAGEPPEAHDPDRAPDPVAKIGPDSRQSSAR